MVYPPSFPRSFVRQVLIKDLDDEFVTDPVAAFPPGTLVRARVLSQTSDSNNDNTNDDNNKQSSNVRTSMPLLSLKVRSFVRSLFPATGEQPSSVIPFFTLSYLLFLPFILFL